MNKDEIKHFIARRVARELENGDVVNLGIGLPTLIPHYVSPDVKITLQAENGFIGLCAHDGNLREDGNYYIVDPSGNPAGIEHDGMFFDSSFSFTIIRGGHVDKTILGSMQVAENGDIANWLIPGKAVHGMGGAMDLVVGAKKVIVAMEHTQKGSPKILKQCTYPLTAKGVVDMIITEMGVMDITPDGIVLREYNPEYTVEQIQAATEASLVISKNLAPME
ncbi:MAG: 3-oxoacid CoA-transferase subunit B [Bacteroidales bacterium]|nr:3-oxoacid CoA-transferase subunit B [Bacteroidales bacterium]